MIENTLEVHNIDIEYQEVAVPYHGMQNIVFINDRDLDYLTWYSEDKTAFGFQFNRGDLKNMFVYILKDSIKISENKVSFKHEVIRNPQNVSVESEEFCNMLSTAMNNVVAEILNWKEETNGA
jgi:hypothetical protein